MGLPFRVKKKKSFFFLEVIRQMGIAFPEGKCKTMHLGKRWQPRRKDAKPAWRSQKSVEEAGGSVLKPPPEAEHSKSSGLAPATDITAIMCYHQKMLGRFPWWFGGSVVKNPPCNAEDGGSIPGLGRFLRLLCKRRPMHSKEDPAQPKMKNRNKLIKKNVVTKMV